MKNLSYRKYVIIATVLLGWLAGMFVSFKTGQLVFDAGVALWSLASMFDCYREGKKKWIILPAVVFVMASVWFVRQILAA